MRVVISAGGTGGHIYPAIAIINKIKEKEPNSEILYIGTTNRMEKDLIPELGIRYEEINVSGLKRKIYGWQLLCGSPVPIPNTEVKHLNADDSWKAKIAPCQYFCYV